MGYAKSGGSRSVVCSECGVGVELASYRLHLSQHLRYTPFECGLCRTFFYTHAAAQAHIQADDGPHPGRQAKLIESRDPGMETKIKSLLGKVGLGGTTHKSPAFRPAPQSHPIHSRSLSLQPQPRQPQLTHLGFQSRGRMPPPNPNTRPTGRLPPPRPLPPPQPHRTLNQRPPPNQRRQAKTQNRQGGTRAVEPALSAQTASFGSPVLAPPKQRTSLSMPPTKTTPSTVKKGKGGFQPPIDLAGALVTMAKAEAAEKATARRRNVKQNKGGGTPMLTVMPPPSAEPARPITSPPPAHHVFPAIEVADESELKPDLSVLNATMEQAEAARVAASSLTSPRPSDTSHDNSSPKAASPTQAEAARVAASSFTSPRPSDTSHDNSSPKAASPTQAEAARVAVSSLTSPRPSDTYDHSCPKATSPTHVSASPKAGESTVAPGTPPLPNTTHTPEPSVSLNPDEADQSEHPQDSEPSTTSTSSEPVHTEADSSENDEALGNEESADIKDSDSLDENIGDDATTGHDQTDIGLQLEELSAEDASSLTAPDTSSVELPKKPPSKANERALKSSIRPESQGTPVKSAPFTRTTPASARKMEPAKSVKMKAMPATERKLPVHRPKLPHHKSEKTPGKKAKRSLPSFAVPTPAKIPKKAVEEQPEATPIRELKSTIPLKVVKSEHSPAKMGSSKALESAPVEPTPVKDKAKLREQVPSTASVSQPSSTEPILPAKKASKRDADPTPRKKSKRSLNTEAVVKDERLSPIKAEQPSLPPPSPAKVEKKASKSGSKLSCKLCKLSRKMPHTEWKDHASRMHLKKVMSRCRLCEYTSNDYSGARMRAHLKFNHKKNTPTQQGEWVEDLRGENEGELGAILARCFVSA